MTTVEWTAVNENLLQAVSNLGIVVNQLDTLSEMMETIASGIQQEGISDQSIDSLQAIRSSYQGILDATENRLQETLNLVNCEALLKTI